MKSAAVPVAIGSSARGAMSVPVAFGRNTGVRENVFILVSALYFAIRLDFLAVLFGFVVLLPVLMQTVMTLHRIAGRRTLLGGLLQLSNEAAMCFFSVLPLSMLLRPRLPLFSMSH